MEIKGDNRKIIGDKGNTFWIGIHQQDYWLLTTCPKDERSDNSL